MKTPMKFKKINSANTKWSWFRRHLNLTLISVCLGLFVIWLIIFTINPTVNADVIGFYLVWGAATLFTAGWVLRCKRRSLWWLLLPVFDVILSLTLENRYDLTFVHDKQSSENEVKGGIMKGALIVIGVIVVILGIGAGVYKTNQSHLLGLYTTTSTPYSNLMAPLIIGGVILIIIGAVIPRQK